MGSDKGLMNYCLQLFAIVRECSPVFGLFALFATVLSLYNEQYEQLNSSPLKNPPLRISPSKSERLGNDQIGTSSLFIEKSFQVFVPGLREKKAAFRGLGES
jgi:hypothetical protein